jgi:hypothetical protein
MFFFEKTRVWQVPTSGRFAASSGKKWTGLVICKGSPSRRRHLPVRASRVRKGRLTWLTKREGKTKWKLDRQSWIDAILGTSEPLWRRWQSVIPPPPFFHSHSYIQSRSARKDSRGYTVLVSKLLLVWVVRPLEYSFGTPPF